MSPLKRFLFCSTLSLASILAQAEVIEVDSMQATLASITKKTLVIYDLDNTLIRPSQTLGSDQWFRSLVEDAKARGFDEAQATEFALSRWTAVQKLTSVISVEADSPRLVRSLQKAGIFVMGLTARPESLAQTTRAQLNSVGYDLGWHAPVRGEVRVEDEGSQKLLARFTQGVIFVGPGGDKGEVLKKFLAKINYTPDSILFVDDRSGNTASVDRALNTTSIPHIEFRYGAADAWVKSFDHALAERQWDEFVRTGKLITDDSM